MAITKEQAQIIHEDINQALKQVEEKHGLSINVDGNVRFSDQEIKMKIVGVTKEKDVEDDLQKKKKDFEKYCKLFQLNKNDFKREITLQGGNRFQLIGINPRAKKRPFICKSMQNGRHYKVDRESVITAVDIAKSNAKKQKV